MHFSFSALNKNGGENETPFMAENKTKMDIHFWLKNENGSQLIILVFFSFSIFYVLCFTGVCFGFIKIVPNSITVTLYNL